MHGNMGDEYEHTTIDSIYGSNSTRAKQEKSRKNATNKRKVRFYSCVTNVQALALSVQNVDDKPYRKISIEIAIWNSAIVEFNCEILTIPFFQTTHQFPISPFFGIESHNNISMKNDNCYDYHRMTWWKNPNPLDGTTCNGTGKIMFYCGKKSTSKHYQYFRRAWKRKRGKKRTKRPNIVPSSKNLLLLMVIRRADT